MTDRLEDREDNRSLTRQSDWMRRAALHYLERYSSSEQNLARLLARKLKRRQTADPERWSIDPEIATRLIAETVDRCRSLGLVDDTTFAEQRVASGRRRGLSGARLVATMTRKGVPRSLAEQAVDAGAVDDAQAALLFARRRRFGPFRSSAAGTDAERREVAAMCRQGFSFALARRVATMEMEQAEAILAGDLI